jgi:hypothetical protein
VHVCVDTLYPHHARRLGLRRDLRRVAGTPRRTRRLARFYNRRRPHGSLSHQPPLQRLEALTRNNLAGCYT